jgi:cell division protein FtsW
MSNSGSNHSYRIARFTTFLDPWAHQLDDGFQIIQSLYAFGHGGFAGAGFGQSIQKLHYLPEAHNDFIFAIIGEELGFIGSAIFLLIYLLFIWRGILIAVRCTDTFGTLTGVGIMGMLAFQAVINIGGVTSTIPLTGVTLPLISYGGSSMMATLISMGVLLSISREQNLAEVKPNKRT